MRNADRPGWLDLSGATSSESARGREKGGEERKIGIEGEVERRS